MQTGRLMLARRLDPVILNQRNKEKRTGGIEDFAVLADNRVKLKENEKKD